MTRRHSKAMAVLTAPVLVATLCATAQTTQQEPSRTGMQQRTDLQFVTFKEAKGMEVLNASEEKLGEISDLVVERGSGRIAFAVLDYGGTLGIGEKKVAVPYHAFNVDNADADKTRLRLAMTAEELDTAPRFNPREWDTVEQRTWTEDLKKFWSDTVAWWNDDDPEQYRQSITTGTPETFEGEIVEVRRLDDQRPEHIALVVRAQGDTTPRIVHLGPSWYVMTYEHVPVRGETVTITAVPLTNREGSFVAARVVYGEGLRLKLRDEKGMTGWSTQNLAQPRGAQPTPDTNRDLEDQPETTRPGATTTTAQQDRDRDMDFATTFWAPRYILVSKVVNADVTDSTGQGAGHVDTLYIECTTGQVAFVGIDPDDALADIGEVNRIVPFELVAWAGKDDVRLATTLDRLRTSTETPDDADRLNDPAFRSKIYTEFNTTERRFAMVGANHMRDMNRATPPSDRNRNQPGTQPGYPNQPGGSDRP